VAAHADNASHDGGSRCRRCDADLTRLTGAARFCYQCGGPLDPDRPLEARSVPVLGRFDDLFSTMIVRGYAHAMFRLGTRYEVRHNGHEAARCYGKASRLGSEPARARLAQIPPPPTLDAVDEDGDFDEHAPGLPEDAWIDEWMELRRRLDP
jgi:hypothetical protein